MSVRWDAVVKNNTLSPARRDPEAPAAASEAARGAPVDVQVWLFGRLAGPAVKNPLRLQFAQGCAMREVIGELDRQIGPDFLRKVVSESGQLLNVCRVFLDGTLVKDIGTPICSKATPATVEIILLQEIEGG